MTTEKAASTTTFRAAEMLRFLHALPFTSSIVDVHVTLDADRLRRYLKHLEENHGKSHSTIYNTVIDLKTTYEWCIMFHAPAHLVSGLYMAMSIQFKKQLKHYRKKKKLDAVKIKSYIFISYFRIFLTLPTQARINCEAEIS